MMCRFHNGALEALSAWRLFEEQRSSCVQCTRTVLCCNSSGLRGAVSCAYPNPGGACQGSVEVLRRHIAAGGTWPMFIPLPPSACSSYSSASYSADHRSWLKESQARNDASFETGNRISGGANPMPFSITNILGRQTTAAAASENRNQTSQRRIVRPWDDKVSFSDRGRSKTRRKSSTEIDESDDEDEGEEEEEEEINVVQDGAISARRLESKGDKNDCPLDALLRMTSRKQFERLDAVASGYTSDDSGADNNQSLNPTKSNSLVHRSTHAVKKRRKTRTAFTNHQVFQLEKRFLYQKYLTPTDRDELALSLRLSNSQVITWFQNRRAKLKRDLEELRADVTAAESLGTEPSTVVLGRLDELLRANGRALKRKDKNFSDTLSSSHSRSTTLSSSSSSSDRNTKATCRGSDESVVSTTVQDIAV